ncbi:hypothetical protein GCM10022215_22650 [Nocardioides fonticola]|uniref:PKD domain-containing protein n=1 Tax=Nocardioides fonticola TaxID=450363 RepID=A0ABP7XJK5_9ACTN
MTCNEDGSGGGSSSGPRYQIRYTLQCKLRDHGICVIPITCAAPPNTFLANVARSLDGITWERYAVTCLTHAEAQAVAPTITPALVDHAFQRLDWPASTVTIQPHDTTLVNLPTILHTTNTQPTTRTITLLGLRITIEATPTRYTWHHGDHTTQTTTSPGHPYPRPGHDDVTHTYAQAATNLPVSVDTTYTGRYRIGTGPWTPIPTSRTITGPTTPLTIRTATPHLIAPD